jgi:hypothetical protein
MKLALDNSNKALEITMRDVMDNLEDAASYMALTCPQGLEVLSIEAPAEDLILNRQHADIHHFPNVAQIKSA